MCKTFDKNRADLMALIYGMGTFTEVELVDRFKATDRETIAIDATQTIGGYLKDLTEFGYLEHEYGQYKVPGRTNSRRLDRVPT